MLLLIPWGKYCSLGLHRMNLLPSQLNRLNFDSSSKGTQFHCSSVHMMCLVANFNQLVFFGNVRLCRCYSTVQIYFIKSSGNSEPWYFNAKDSISSFRDSSCCHKWILFWFITNPSVFPCSSFPRLASWFLGSTWTSFL